jgi:hypothetical protein
MSCRTCGAYLEVDEDDLEVMSKGLVTVAHVRCCECNTLLCIGDTPPMVLERVRRRQEDAKRAAAAAEQAQPPPPEFATYKATVDCGNCNTKATYEIRRENLATGVTRSVDLMCPGCSRVTTVDAPELEDT